MSGGGTAGPQPLPSPLPRFGAEVELLAPPGRSRRDLAETIAERVGGTVHRVFVPQSEPSKVPGTPVFESLTLGFEVRVGERWIARCADDLTLQEDLRKDAAPQPGWYRIVSDDVRFLRLVSAVSNAEQELTDVLTPLAELFGTEPTVRDGMVRVADAHDLPVAMAAPLPGERERPCELITAPSEDPADLRAMLGDAQKLGFSVPSESATHLHVDGRPWQDAGRLRALVRLWSRWGGVVKGLVATNPRCRRLGDWPEALHRVVEAPGFARLEWPDAQTRLADVQLSKYCDLNLRNLVHPPPDKLTVELRVLPGTLLPDAVERWLRLFAALLDRARRPVPRRPRARWSERAQLLHELTLTREDRAHWMAVSA